MEYCCNKIKSSVFSAGKNVCVRWQITEYVGLGGWFYWNKENSIAITGVLMTSVNESTHHTFAEDENGGK